MSARVELVKGRGGLHRAPTWAESFLDLLWLDDLEIGSPDDCWRWLGKHDSGGYARRGRRLVTRLLGGLMGRLSAQMHHVCENPWCVNPGHLEALATQREHSSRHRVKTCIRGHEFTTENTYVTSAGLRQCRRCSALRQRRYREQGEEAA